jgi:hypothetical protein
MENYREWSSLNVLLREIWILVVFMCTRVAKWKWKEWFRLGFCLAIVFFSLCFPMVYSWVASYRKNPLQGRNWGVTPLVQTSLPYTTILVMAL